MVTDKGICERTIWWTLVLLMAVVEVSCLSGPNVCMVKQKFNVTKRVKYRAPMSVRTYEWCLSMPPRCSKWTTEMKDLTRLETEERTAETAVCCPGYKMKDITCIPICPHGKTGAGCLEDCPPKKWGPNCVNDCKNCEQGICSPIHGECMCHTGWQGERCEISFATTPGAMMETLTTAKPSISTKITTLPTTIITTTSPKPNIPPSTPIDYATTNRMPTTEDFETDVSPSIIQNNTSKSIYFDDNVSTTPLPKNRSHISSTKEANQRISTVSYKTDSSSESSFNIETPFANTTAKPTNPTLLKSTVFTTDGSLSSSEAMTTESYKTTTAISIFRENKQEASKRTESTVKPTTAKFKPKEIWIRPAQKGDNFEIKSKVLDTKMKINETVELTTPKTIVVSIIPTSVSYATFKRIALTTASLISLKSISSAQSNYTIEKDSVTVPTIQSTTKKRGGLKINRIMKPFEYTTNPPGSRRIVFFRTSTSSTPSNELNMIPTIRTPSSLQETKQGKNITERMPNSMVSEKPTPYSLTTASSGWRIPFSELRLGDSQIGLTKAETEVQSVSPDVSATASSNMHQLKTNQSLAKTVSLFSTPKTTLILAQNTTSKHIFPNKQYESDTNASLTKQVQETNNEKALTDSYLNDTPVTKDPTKVQETFNILTEPEQITAVMSDKGNERSTVNLISVLSIAGGVMMAIITVAVVIVMVERCKKPRYEDERKYNEIRMQVMVDENDASNMPPPPYVRSIFHTPLPDPPSMEKCHYQPISTLDRNLKQFMRPVVVQTISPLMLENFRGILECHYDHLPRRSHDCDSMQMRCSIASSIDERSELLPKRSSSLTSSTIDAMKCEATMDVIDSTTSEPLYAEIPCWRPSFEHAVEVVNLNGEAVTEL